MIININKEVRGEIRKETLLYPIMDYKVLEDQQ